MKSALAAGVERLIAEQTASWPLLASGVEGLRKALTRTERVAGRELFVRHIPHRIGSTTAAVDAASVARRPCFLCTANMPPEEKGLAFDEEFTLYCNPFPILEGHLTIVHRDHRPQRIAGFFETLLRLSEALPGFFVIYNGPECGASAPDHLHFQACSRALFPIERDSKETPGPCIPNYARQVLLLRHNDGAALQDRLQFAVDAIAEVAGAESEPLINIAAFHDEGRWTVVLFPRRKHRPRVYETGELTVSPAAIDLCGVFVVPVLSDYRRIRGADIESIFEEVTMPSDLFNRVLARLQDVL